MTPRDFVYWLQGFLELSNLDSMDEEQRVLVVKHLQLVLGSSSSETPRTLPPRSGVVLGKKIC